MLPLIPLAIPFLFDMPDISKKSVLLLYLRQLSVVSRLLLEDVKTEFVLFFL
jgi:hypothetical protein